MNAFSDHGTDNQVDLSNDQTVPSTPVFRLLLHTDSFDCAPLPISISADSIAIIASRHDDRELSLIASSMKMGIIMNDSLSLTFQPQWHVRIRVIFDDQSYTTFAYRNLSVSAFADILRKAFWDRPGNFLFQESISSGRFVSLDEAEYYEGHETTELLFVFASQIDESIEDVTSESDSSDEDPAFPPYDGDSPTDDMNIDDNDDDDDSEEKAIRLFPFIFQEYTKCSPTPPGYVAVICPDSSDSPPPKLLFLDTTTVSEVRDICRAKFYSTEGVLVIAGSIILPGEIRLRDIPEHFPCLNFSCPGRV